MNVSSVGNSQYIIKADSLKNNVSKNIANTLTSNATEPKYEGLDSRASAILDQLVPDNEGKSHEQAFTRAVVARIISREIHVPNGKIDESVEFYTNTDISEEGMIEKLNKSVELQEKNMGPDPHGIKEIISQLRDFYVSGYTPLDLKI